MIHSSNLDQHRGNGWFVALGVIMILTGIGAFAFPLIASLSVEESNSDMKERSILSKSSGSLCRQASDE